MQRLQHYLQEAVCLVLPYVATQDYFYEHVYGLQGPAGSMLC
jgi:hypothetical protein